MMPNKNEMVILGVTGGIGSGKTAVLQILKEKYGAYLLEADKLAHRLMEPGQSVYHAVVAAFGGGILNEDKTIDRGRLGDIVFHDRTKLALLNSLTHPLVKEAVLKEIQNEKEKHTRLFVIEAALLIQDGYQDVCTGMCYVYARQDVRVERLCRYRGFTPERAEAVIASQESEAFYKENSDFVVDNSGNLKKTEEEIDKIAKQLF